MLQERDIGEDIPRQILTFQKTVVEQRHGNRIDDVVILHLQVGIVAFQVINRGAGKGRQGIGDDTFARIRFFQAFVRCGIGSVQSDLPPVAQRRVDIGTEGITGELGTDDGTLLIHEGTGQVVFHLIGTTLDTDLMLMLKGGAEDSVLPVGTDAEDGRIGIVVIGFQQTYRREVVVVFRKFPQIQEADTAGLALDGDHTVIGEFSVSALTALGGDEDNAVCTLGTVDGRCRGVLQDFHRHDIGGVDGRQRGNGGNSTVAEGITQTEGSTAGARNLDDNAINHIKRLCTCIDGRLTTDADGGGGTRSTGGLYRGDTGGTALQGLVQVGDDGALDGVFLHGDGSAGHIALLHSTVTHDDDFVEEFGIFRQFHVDDRLAAHNDFLRCIADGREHECRAGLHRDHVVSIEVCDGTVGGALLHDTGSDDRADIVRDGTGDLVLCEQGRSGEERQHEGHKFLFHATWFWLIIIIGLDY